MAGNHSAGGQNSDPHNTCVVGPTHSGGIAVYARSSGNDRWVQVACCRSLDEATSAAFRLDYSRNIRVDTIAEWRLENWGRDAAIVDPNEAEDDL